jgi:hypothetical protein
MSSRGGHEEDEEQDGEAGRQLRQEAAEASWIKPPAVSESFLQAFPNLREVIRRADAQVKAFIEIEADILRQFHEKGYAELDEALLSPSYRIHFKKKKRIHFHRWWK